MRVTRPRAARVTATRLGALVAGVALVVGCAPAGAQEGASATALARRIASAPAGDVRFDYASRTGACGDGRDMVGFGRMFHGSNIEGMGTWGNNGCKPGDAHVVVMRRDGEVVDVRTRIGGRTSDSSAANGGGTSLGRVSAIEAADYFLAVAAKSDGRVARGALWAAALADSAQPSRRFLAYAQDDAKPWKARNTAMQLAGATGDASLVPELERIARSGAGDDGVDRKKDAGNIARGAVEALAVVPDDAGIDALVRLAGDAPTSGVRKAAVFHAANSGDPRGLRIARTIAEDEKADIELRNTAIFAMLNRDDTGQAERTWARQLFPRLTSDKLRDPILMGLAQHGTADDLEWVLSLASDEKLPVHVRRQAVFWAGQGGAPITDMVATYRAVPEREVKEHMIFALSQRDEAAATDALVDIARKDADHDMRKKALFWLGQRKDARSMQVISDIINQP